MSNDVTLPALGESVTEGTVTRWLKAVGDTVAMDEPLLEVSTDKVDTEIPSPFAGTLTEILVPEDETVEVGAVLGRIGDGSAAPAPAAEPVAEAPAPAAEPVAEAPAPAAEPVAEAPAPVAPTPVPVPPSAPDAPSFGAPAPAPAASPAAAPTTAASPAPAPAPAPALASAAAAVPNGSGSGYVTPIVRKLANERGVDLAAIAGTGVGGRIRKEDVIAAAEAPAPTPPAAPAASTPAPPASATDEVSPLRGTTVKMTRLRSIIAERMMESLHGMAQLTTVIEVDVTKIAALRGRAKEAFKEREGANLTFLSFFTLAAAEALRSHPVLNAKVEDGSIVYPDHENLALAVDTPKGLITPVMKNAGEASLADHARGIADLAARARDNKLTADDMAGATFTVTNTGSIGAVFDTPIVPSPQVGILGTGVIQKRPVVLPGADGQDTIAIRSMCYLALSYDHRIVDGADASRFLQAVKKRIEGGDFEAALGL